MLFNSLIFTLFLPLAFIGYWISPTRYRNYFLLFASFYFYFSYNPWFLLLLIGTASFDYWAARQMLRHPSRKKIFLLLSVGSNLLVLFIFKYFVFFYNSSLALVPGNYATLEQLIIPAGLSFYTFQSMSYSIDVYRGTYRPNDTLFDFLLFVSFFPHMVAGPVVRYGQLMPQLKARTYFRDIAWGDAARLVTWGYFKKLVIADNLNSIVTPIFQQVNHLHGAELLLGGLLFVVQVYCDFSGYSDIATGVARLFNIRLSLNWRRPLLATSLHDFWRRNHISITTWFRDYLYIGLGGSRVSYRRWLLNLLVVFLVSGFWHGASFTFIVWGGLHGCLYLAETLLRKTFPQLHVPALLGWVYLIGFHTVALMAFRANSTADMFAIYQAVFHPAPDYFSLNHLWGMQDLSVFLLAAFSICILALKELNEEFAFVNRFPALYRLSRPAVYIAFVVLIFVLGNFSANTFIYFQF